MGVPERICLPADGVYAGTFTAADGIERAAALSLGRRPTFYAEAGMLLLEAHVLDFDGDLYDQPTGAVHGQDVLRGEERFESVDALVAQEVGIAGAAGALTRYGIGLAIGPQRFPWATLAINITGSFPLAVRGAEGHLRPPRPQ